MEEYQREFLHNYKQIQQQYPELTEKKWKILETQFKSKYDILKKNLDYLSE